MDACGRYRIVRRIASGGMAEVFEAVAVGASGFERRVAIKRILPEQIGDPATCRMFVDEARIASRLHDRNLLPVLDYGLADGAPFQVIELVDGVDVSRLAQMARAAGLAMPVEVALHLCSEVANGLFSAHGATDDRGRPLGIVHRDVSPGNILVSWNGEVKLGDFGVAFARDRSERTATGIAKGKLLYMAPEQMTAGSVDARTDVFALGCVLHMLVAGTSPLAGDVAVATILAGGELPVDSGLPDDVRAIVARAVRARRSERFGTASDMAEATFSALAQRTREEPRTVLRRFLDPLRPARQVESRGKLDAMLDVELVLTSSSGDIRCFEASGVIETVRARRDGSPPQVDPDASAMQPRPGGAPPLGRADSSPVRSRSFGRAVPLVLGGAVVIALAVAVALPRDGRGPGGPATVAESAPTTGSHVPPARPVGEPPASADPVARANPSNAQQPEAHEKKAGKAGRPRRSGTATVQPPSREDGPPDTTIAAPTRGFLRIGGATAQNAQVLVDGRPWGYAPARISLEVGSHQVELRVSGRTIASRTVTVTPEDTARTPQAWMLP